MITNVEKNLYNTYLRISRTAKNKPFSYRKDFSDMDESTQLHLTRISNLLFKYPHINPDEYFLAPYKAYPNAEHFTIDYYSGMGAVEAFSIYMRQIQEMPPDSDEQLNFIKKSLKFIGSFCIKSKIEVKDYPNHKTGLTYDWMKHIKRHEISVYAIMEFPEVSSIIQAAAEDERELFLGDVGTYFFGYKSKYLQSTIAKQLMREGLEKISKIVKSTVEK